MVRIAKQTDPAKLEALRVQINDTRYLQVAIERIAENLTDEIINLSGRKSDYKV